MTTVGLASLTGLGVVSAATNNNGQQGLVDKIASQFNLNKDDVQKVFDDNRAEHEAERQAKASERLQSLVDDGTITAEQKSAIETKMAELKSKREANREEFKNLSEDERKAKMDEKRTELEAWATEQGLDLTKLKGIFGGHHGPGHGHGPGHAEDGPDNDQDS